MQQQEPVNVHQPLLMSNRRRWAVTIGVMTGMFLAALEATVVGTAMPTVISSLGGLEHYSWVFSSYLLTSTVTVPLWGKLSDLYGRRPLFQAGVVIFLVGSVLSGISRTMPQLILFRGIQGLGAGGLVPVAMTIIGDIYTLEERTRMQALFSGVWGLSSIVGPVLGGFLTDQLSWRWIFFLNLPFGIASSIIMGLALIEPAKRNRPVIDYAGAITLTISIGLLMLVLVSEGETTPLFSLRNLMLLVASSGFLLLFLRIEKRAKDPVIPFSLFSNQVVWVAIVTGFLTGVAMFGAISFIPLFAQGTRGSTPTEAGTLLTPLMLSWVILSILGGRLLLRIGYRSTVIAGCALLTAGFIILVSLKRNVPVIWLYVDLAIIGAGLGLTMLTLLIAVQQAVPRTLLGTATSLNQFSRSIGGAIGVAIMGAILAAGLSSRLPGMTSAANVSADPNALMEQSSRAALAPHVLDQLQQALFESLGNVFWVAILASGLSMIVVLWLPASTKPGEGPTPKAPDAESDERLVIAQFTTLEAKDEPIA
jgi:EmrB/QacA subfamily drug resistance transporter